MKDIKTYVVASIWQKETAAGISQQLLMYGVKAESLKDAYEQADALAEDTLAGWQQQGYALNPGLRSAAIITASVL